MRGKQFVFAAFFLALTACLDGSNPFGGTPDVPLEELTAKEIYDKAQHDLDRKRTASAAELFGEVERLYPYSEWAKRGLIMQAYSHYLGQDYDNARSSAKRYLDFYPASEDAAYAQYIVALSYYDQIADVGRDQALAFNALQELRIVIERYSESEYVEEAQLRFALAYDHLAAKEMEVGRNYLKRGFYGAAVKRFRVVVDDYKTSGQTPEALHRLAEAYLSLGLLNEAYASAALLAKDYSENEWNTEAQNLVNAHKAGKDISSGSGGVLNRFYRQTVQGKWL